MLIHDSVFEGPPSTKWSTAACLPLQNEMGFVVPWCRELPTAPRHSAVAASMCAVCALCFENQVAPTMVAVLRT
jgi:hypothetical protein